MGHPEFDKDIQPIGTIFSITPQPVNDAVAAVNLAKAFTVKMSLRKKKKSSLSPSKMNKKSKTTMRTSKSVDPVEKFQIENDDSIIEIIGELAKLDNREVEDKLKQMTDRKILDFKAV